MYQHVERETDDDSDSEQLVKKKTFLKSKTLMSITVVSKNVRRAFVFGDVCCYTYLYCLCPVPCLVLLYHMISGGFEKILLYLKLFRDIV